MMHNELLFVLLTLELLLYHLLYLQIFLLLLLLLIFPRLADCNLEVRLGLFLALGISCGVLGTRAFLAHRLVLRCFHSYHGEATVLGHAHIFAVASLSILLHNQGRLDHVLVLVLKHFPEILWRSILL